MGKFGDRLKYLRNEKKLTQKEFSKIFKISESSVGMYERNEREPSFEMINRFSEYFGVTADYLLGRSDDPNLHREDPDFPELDPAPRKSNEERRYFLYEGSDEKFTKEEIEEAKEYIEYLRWKREQKNKD